MKQDMTNSGLVKFRVAPIIFSALPLDSDGTLHGELPGKDDSVLYDLDRDTFIIVPRTALQVFGECRCTIKIYNTITQNWAMADGILIIRTPDFDGDVVPGYFIPQ